MTGGIHLTPLKRRHARAFSSSPNVPAKRSRHSARFHGRRITMDTSMTEERQDVKKRKLHEAQLIPGLQEGRIYGFPNTLISKIRYGDVFTLTSTLGAIGYNTFNANSIFDPDSTGVGHQPMFRDQYAAIYDQYVVIGSKITVHFAAQDTKNFVVGITGDDDNLFPTALATKLEQNNSVWTLLGGMGSDPKTLTMTFEPNMCFGIDAKSDGSSATAQGSNPTELWCFGVWVHAVDASLTGKVDITVEIEYTVKYSELTTPTPS